MLVSCKPYTGLRQTRARRFETRTKIYASIWCCVNKHPGHVWYDLWWDKVPRVDRHNRNITGPWVPITGP